MTKFKSGDLVESIIPNKGTGMPSIEMVDEVINHHKYGKVFTIVMPNDSIYYSLFFKPEDYIKLSYKDVKFKVK